MSRPTRIVIQSRLSSQRLPAKGLLPLAGTPSVVLCAKRVANTGLEVIVATSSETSDDPTQQILANHNVTCFRGDLNNVLKRMVDATQDMDENGIVVRLTADNVFPDGTFLEELIESFLENNLTYLGTSSPEDGLPYGLSAEAMSVDILRKALNHAKHPGEFEHVTPWIQKNHSSATPFRPKAMSTDMANYRCTMDTFDDYLKLHTIFNTIDNPVDVSWEALCDRLRQAHSPC